MLLERTRTNGRERSHQVDKLGVTGSSPVPPIESRCKQAYVVATRGDASRCVARLSLATRFSDHGCRSTESENPAAGRRRARGKSRALTAGKPPCVEPASDRRQLCGLGVTHP